MRSAHSFRVLAFALSCAACATAKPTTTPAPAAPVSQPAAPPPSPRPAPVVRVVHDTVAIADPEQERRLGRLELRLMEKDALIEDLQSRLDDSRADIVRTLAKVQSSASRAEAASGVAEAELALRSLQASDGAQATTTVQVGKIVKDGSAEFDKKNYGGALYLANQAKALAAAYSGRGANAAGARLRPGETMFAIPVHLKVSSRANVREGPGTTFPVAFSADAGTLLSGVSYLDEWIRVFHDDGRTGWIFRTLVVKP